MKKVLTTLAFTLFVLATSAQTPTKEYDYVWSQSDGYTVITIVTPDKSVTAVDLKSGAHQGRTDGDNKTVAATGPTVRAGWLGLGRCFRLSRNGVLHAQAEAVNKLIAVRGNAADHG